MKPSVLAIRSLGAEFASRLFLPVMITVTVSAVGLLGISIWLATLSLWWLILVVLISIVTVAAIVALIISWAIIKMVAPIQTKDQKKQAKALVDKLQNVAEITVTPKFVLLFRVMRDLVFPAQKGFISSVSEDSITLARDLNTLRDSFK